MSEISPEDLILWEALTESRKADRRRMGEEVIRLAQRVAPTTVKVTVTPDTLGDANRQDINVEGPFGLRGRVTVGGRRRPKRFHNVFLMSWFFDVSPGIPRNKILVSSFSRDVNPHHRRKASDVAYSFQTLMETLADRFRRIEAGEAMIDLPED